MLSNNLMKCKFSIARKILHNNLKQKNRFFYLKEKNKLKIFNASQPKKRYRLMLVFYLYFGFNSFIFYGCTIIYYEGSRPCVYLHWNRFIIYKQFPKANGNFFAFKVKLCKHQHHFFNSLFLHGLDT